MRKVNIITAEQAAQLVKDNDTITSIGFVSSAHPEALTKALEKRFLEKIWGYDSEAEINVVWVYISYLRKKLSALHADIQIKATRNAGYSLEERS